MEQKAKSKKSTSRKKKASRSQKLQKTSGQGVSKPASQKVWWKLHEPEPAHEKIMRATKALKDKEEIKLSQAADRILAQNIKSPLSLPFADRSERDGYALRAAECKKVPLELTQTGSIRAGDKKSKTRLQNGSCIKVATGALMPPGSDTVVMFEEVEKTSQGILLTQAPGVGSWVSKAGSDIQRGQLLAQKGDIITPPLISTLAVCGIASVEVIRKPRVLVFTTGNEVKSPRKNAHIQPESVFDGNSDALVGLLRQNGADLDCRRPVKDTFEALAQTLQKAAEDYDLIVFTGGTSVGEKDYGRRVLDSLGKTIIHGVNIKPGKPLLFGKVDQTLVMGLPGFPVSALLLAYNFLIPLVQKLAGYGNTLDPWVDTELIEDIQPDPHKHFVVPVAFHEEGGGVSSTFRGSSAISTLAQAEGYIVLPPGNKAYQAGTQVSVRMM